MPIAFQDKDWATLISLKDEQVNTARPKYVPTRQITGEIDFGGVGEAPPPPPGVQPFAPSPEHERLLQMLPPNEGYQRMLQDPIVGAARKILPGDPTETDWASQAKFFGEAAIWMLPVPGLQAWRAAKGAPLAEKLITRTFAAPGAALEKGIGLAAKVPKAAIRKLLPSGEKTLSGVPIETAGAKLWFRKGRSNATISLAPESLSLASDAQKIAVHQSAFTKNLMYPVGHKQAGKVRPQYRQLAKLITGKTSSTKMTIEEADVFKSVLDNLVTYGSRPPKIPKTTQLISKELADKLPYLTETGFFDRFRQTPHMLRKIGLHKELWEPLQVAEIERSADLLTFRSGLNSIRKGLSAESSKVKIFDALDGKVAPELLNPQERTAYNFLKTHFDDWANALKLPAEKRRAKYITHIFEESMRQDIRAKRSLDPELIRSMDFNFARDTFNPFLKERLGMEAGLIRDPFLAADVYEQYALRQLYYQPLVKKLAAFEPLVNQYAGPNAARQIRALANRLANRPDAIDRELNYSIKELMDKLPKNPIAQGLAKILGKDTANPAALIAHNYSSLLYQSFLGLRPVSAIRNLSQQSLAVIDAGAGNFAKGLALRGTKQGKAALAKSLVLRSRQSAYLPGVDQTTLGALQGRTQEIALYMFKVADKWNVENSFLAGYSRAKALGLPEKWAVKLGDEVAMNTQFLYTKMARSLFEETALGRFLTPFTSWPRNWLELMSKWASGKQSQVLIDYMAETGIKLKLPTGLASRKEFLQYLAFVTAAYAAQQITPVKALEYTGFTSVKSLGQFMGGDLPSLQVIGGIGKVVGGASAGDERMMKEGWNDIRPDRLIGIVRQLESVAEGKSDFLTLFLYLNRQKAIGESKRQPSSGYKPTRAIK